jgi:hypothetical protein
MKKGLIIVSGFTVSQGKVVMGYGKVLDACFVTEIAAFVIKGNINGLG